MEPGLLVVHFAMFLMALTLNELGNQILDCLIALSRLNLHTKNV